MQAGALALVASILWGGNQVFIKIGLEGIPPLAMAGLRFVLGGLTVALAARWARVALAVPKSAWPGLAGLSLVFITQIYLLNQGTVYTEASRSTVMISAYPFFTALFAHFFIPGDQLTLNKVGGLALAFAGVVLVFAESLVLTETDFLLGDGMVLLSAAFLGLRQILIKRLVHGLHPFQVLFWQALLSLPAFALLSALFERQGLYHFDGAVLVALLYQGLVVAGLCFILWVFLLQRHSASRLGVYGFSTPVCGALLSYLLLGETLTPAVLASVALVGAGVVVVNRK